MSCCVRIEFPSALYHVTAHGNRCEDIFEHFGLHFATVEKVVRGAGESYESRPMSFLYALMP